MAKILSVTMSDVGRAAGVSQASVSLAFRHDPSIPAATRQRILTVARRLGYRRHAAISKLMAQVRARKPMTIKAELAALTFWADRAAFEQNPTWQDQWRGAQARAHELGYVLEEFWMGSPGMNLRRLSSVMRARNIEGLLVFPLRAPQALEFPFDRFSATSIGYTLEAPMVHRVVTAHFESVLIALRELRIRGYANIGLVVDEQMSERVHRNWKAAFYAYGLERGRVDSMAILTLASDGPQDRLGRWLRRFRPDAVLCGGPHPIRAWLGELGWSAPDDIGIVRLANIVPEERCACIDEKWRVVGAAAVDLLVSQLHRDQRGTPERKEL
jgi:DNA-binding LacI/PurR family transcriptional regulator